MRCGIILVLFWQMQLQRRYSPSRQANCAVNSPLGAFPRSPSKQTDCSLVSAAYRGLEDGAVALPLIWQRSMHDWYTFKLASVTIVAVSCR